MVVRSASSSPIAGSPIADSPISGSRELPPRASLENLRNQARTLQKQHREGDAEAIARVAVWLGAGAPSSAPEAPAARPWSGVVTPLRLHDAQFVLAREYGFASWPRLVEHFEAQQSRERVRRENGRVWIDGVPRLRLGASPEPTFIGAFEAAFRSSERPLDIMTLMGDSGLAYRLRWATRDQGNAWCGSGPCGEWPEEVAALGAATGYGSSFSRPKLGVRCRPSIGRASPLTSIVAGPCSGSANAWIWLSSSVTRRAAAGCCLGVGGAVADGGG
jgi:hypothetical protein